MALLLNRIKHFGICEDGKQCVQLKGHKTGIRVLVVMSWDCV
jgi:hypothetical protein